jgi:hypothetical protein
MVTYFQEVIFTKQTAGTFQEVPSVRGNHLKGRKFVSKICRVKISLDFFARPYRMVHSGGFLFVLRQKEKGKFVNKSHGK